MSKLSDYYADRIRKALDSGESYALLKEELMKRINITDRALMDAVLEEAGRKAKLRCSSGLYYIHDNKDQYKDHKDRHKDKKQASWKDRQQAALRQSGAPDRKQEAGR